jgi:hypothetical protein
MINVHRKSPSGHFMALPVADMSAAWKLVDEWTQTEEAVSIHISSGDRLIATIDKKEGKAA